tara:strand:- start:185 stop:373 length:189 start_codon:yes stop_codon:yes gene_type:complete
MCPTTTALPPTSPHLKIMTNHNDDYDPTPYYLYDDTNGEPPISWKERQELEDKKFREEYGWA